MRFQSKAIERYDELVAALRKRRMDLGLTNTDLELMADLQPGYMAKVENYTTENPKAYARNIGPVVMNKLLDGLGVCLIMVDKKNMLARASMPEVQKNQAIKGGKKRAEALSKKRRIAIARAAARKRWAKKRGKVSP